MSSKRLPGMWSVAALTVVSIATVFVATNVASQVMQTNTEAASSSCKNGIQTQTLYRRGCSKTYKEIRFTCKDGSKGQLLSSGCVQGKRLQDAAAGACAKVSPGCSSGVSGPSGASHASAPSGVSRTSGATGPSRHSGPSGASVPKGVSGPSGSSSPSAPSCALENEACGTPGHMCCGNLECWDYSGGSHCIKPATTNPTCKQAGQTCGQGTLGSCCAGLTCKSQSLNPALPGVCATNANGPQ